MMSLVRIREQGQATLSLELRNQMGLQQGDLLEASEGGFRRLDFNVHFQERDTSSCAIKAVV
jgi:bifunctional DNA-binding transcriptional regulator/antitoxin component of YhaV-PrlF toxin-antitoxin module